MQLTFKDVVRAVLTASAIALPCVAALAHDGHGDAQASNAPDAHDAHAHHHAPAEGTRGSRANYSLPSIKMVRNDGKTVDLAQDIDDGRPVILDFIYTTCTTICPVSSQAFSDVQKQLGGERDKVHMVSISIDPEQDTPARLADYSKKFAAGAQWNYYTGTVAASLAAQRAFDVYRGDKMAHFAVTFLRLAPGQPWLRLEGFATGEKLLQEYRQLLASR